MKTYLDCIPCFFRQALEAARMAGLAEHDQRDILSELGRMLPELSSDATPPEMGHRIHKRIQEAADCSDPYREIKMESNRRALELYPELVRRVEVAASPLRTAVELAILGNIMDYGALQRDAVQSELERRLTELETREEDSPTFAWRVFEENLDAAKDIIYLADNAGETVFDRVLIETIRKRKQTAKITYAVREEPILNDAVRQDAEYCGLAAAADIVSSGSKAPGTVLAECSPRFLDHLGRSDMIISKGQGNFEALSEQDLPLFFLFVAKCPVIARDAGCRVGDALLLPADALLLPGARRHAAPRKGP